MQAAFAGTTAANGTPITYAKLYRYGLYLDNTGKIGAGSELWRVAAGVASSVPELASTQASTLAQGALDRALMERCTVALEMIDEVKNLPKGPVASFNAGMAAALCGDQTYAYKTIAAMQKNYPQNTAVVQYYVPQLQAAAEIGVNEPEKALGSLISLEAIRSNFAYTLLAGDGECRAGTDTGRYSRLPNGVGPSGGVPDARQQRLSNGRSGSSAGECGESPIRRPVWTLIGGFLTLWGEADRGPALMLEALAKDGQIASAHHLIG